MMSQVFVLVTLLFASLEDLGDSRLRITDARAAAMVKLGLESSLTFRGMVAEVGAGDVMVLIDSDQSLPGSQTGRMRLVGQAGAWRYVQVSIRANLPPHAFVAALAHELQHVSEVIAHPEVRDVASLEHLYRRIGREYQRSGRRAFETDAARQIAVAVRREFINHKPSRTTNANSTVR